MATNLLVLAAIVLILCGGVYFRERSWAGLVLLLKEELREERELNRHLRFQLEVLDNSTSFFCSQNSTETEFVFANQSKATGQVVVGAPNLLDWSDVLLMSLCCAVMLSEAQLFHSSVLPQSQCFARVKSNEEFVSFVRRTFPVTNAVMSSLLMTFGAAAWLGLFSRRVFVLFSLKIVLAWFLARTLAIFSLNAIRIRKYLPTSWNSWKTQLATMSWWMWLVSRLLGVDSAHGVSPWAIGSSLAMVWLVWPYRYFYFYSHLIPDQTQASIFIINMILHVSCVVWWLSLTQISVFGSPPWESVPLISRSTTVLYLLRRTLPNLLYIAVLPVAGSLLLCALRIVIFSIFGGTSWYAMFIAWVFVVWPIILVVASNPVMSCLVLKRQLTERHREAFVESFEAIFVRRDNGSQDASTESEQNKSYRELAESVFVRLVDRTARCYVLGGGGVQYSDMDDRMEALREQQAQMKFASQTDEEFDVKFIDFCWAFEETKRQVKEVQEGEDFRFHLNQARVAVTAEDIPNDDNDDKAPREWTWDERRLNEAFSKLIGSDFR